MSDNQVFLPGLEAKPRRKSTVVDVAAVPVEVDTPASHLSGVYDYAVTNKLQDQARPGARVRVRFNGQLTDGFIVGPQKPIPADVDLVRLERVVGSIRPLTADVYQASQQLAATYSGAAWDILRSAIPARHAAAEKTFLATVDVDDNGKAVDCSPVEGRGRPPRSRLWPAYAAGEAFLDRLFRGGNPWAAVTAPPGLAALATPKVADAHDHIAAAQQVSDRAYTADSGTVCSAPSSQLVNVPWWAIAIADAAAETIAGGRSAIIVVPDARDIHVAKAALQETITKPIVTFHADLGPQQRYNAYLAAITGHAKVVIGTRSATWAPLPNLGLIALWNDSDDQLHDPKTPYLTADSVARTRAQQHNAALMYCHYVPSVTTAGLIARGDMVAVDVETNLRRRTLPRVIVTDEGTDRDPLRGQQRLPEQITSHVRKTLGTKPVLIHVPRTGNTPLLQCGNCRTRAHCQQCGNILQQRSPHEPPECGTCGAMHAGWTCTACGSTTLRAVILGVDRTAADFGRLFPNTPIRTITGDQPLLTWQPPQRAIALATPGAQPWTPTGYATTVLMDPWLTTNQPDADGDQKALRHWCDTIAATTGTTHNNGTNATVFIAGTAPDDIVDAIRTWNFTHWATTRWHQRTELQMAPAAIQATLTGPRADVMAYLAEIDLPDHITVLGPVLLQADPTNRSLLDDADDVQMLLREPATPNPYLPPTLRATSKRLGSARRRVPKIRVEPGLWLAKTEKLCW